MEKNVDKELRIWPWVTAVSVSIPLFWGTAIWTVNYFDAKDDASQRNKLDVIEQLAEQDNFTLDARVLLGSSQAVGSLVVSRSCILDGVVVNITTDGNGDPNDITNYQISMPQAAVPGAVLVFDNKADLEGLVGENPCTTISSE